MASLPDQQAEIPLLIRKHPPRHGYNGSLGSCGGSGRRRRHLRHDLPGRAAGQDLPGDPRARDPLPAAARLDRREPRVRRADGGGRAARPRRVVPPRGPGAGRGGGDVPGRRRPAVPRRAGAPPVVRRGVRRQRARRARGTAGAGVLPDPVRRRVGRPEPAVHDHPGGQVRGPDRGVHRRARRPDDGQRAGGGRREAAAAVDPAARAALPGRGRVPRPGPGDRVRTRRLTGRGSRVAGMSTHGADSEVGTLQTVMLHRPGPELKRLTPRNNDRLLFDGIPWISRAQDEHDAFAQALRDRGAEVVYLTELLTETLESEDARTLAIAGALSRLHLGDTLRSYLGAALGEQSPEELTQSLTAGIRNDELRGG